MCVAVGTRLRRSPTFSLHAYLPHLTSAAIFGVGLTKQACELERAYRKYVSEEASEEFTSHMRAEMEARAQAAMQKEASIAWKL